MSKRKMKYEILATDYDETLAEEGIVSDASHDALMAFRQAGGSIILITGRELSDLKQVCTCLDAFDLIVAENGALLYWPYIKQEKLLAPVAPQELVVALQQRGVEPLSVGRTIVATREPHSNVARNLIEEMRWPIEIIYNKGAVMLLPAGIDKGHGFRHARKHLDLNHKKTIGFGDGENDYAFLKDCDLSVAVSNATQELKSQVDCVANHPSGLALQQFIQELVRE